MSIACLLVPSLALTCELVERPQLVGRAVALADEAGLRVFETTPQAMQRGVRVGMTLREAVALCPALAVLEQRPARIVQAAERLIEAVGQVSPLVEEVEPGVVLADLVGLEGLYPDTARLAEALLKWAPRELRPRLGIAEERFTAIAAAYAVELERAPDVAKLGPGLSARGVFDMTPPTVGATARVAVLDAPAREAPRWIRVPRGESAAFLADRPARLLPLELAALAQLALFGVRTVGEFAALPRHAVAAQFGTAGDRAWLAATGTDPTPVRPRPFAGERVIEQSQAEPPLVSRESMALHARQLLHRAMRQPRASRRFVRFVRLRAVTDDDRLWEKTQTLREPTGDRDRLLIVLHTFIEYSEFPGPIAHLELALGGLTSEQGRQGGLFLDHARRREQLDEMVRQLKVRFGRSPMTQVVEVEPWSRLPERRFALMDYDP
ncbi:MAG: DNA polymerase Y family protein [Chloroflexi bacterium]|nr:DNA polymerase Y family protein [Chloroflexota bacterium]MDA1145965.1 DNA polymerase Y family protein [Chloroflexota bacterium]